MIGLPKRVLVWRNPWGRAHYTAKCTLAFFEDPAAFGEKRMREISTRKAALIGKPVCPECKGRLIRARMADRRRRAEKRSA